MAISGFSKPHDVIMPKKIPDFLPTLKLKLLVSGSGFALSLVLIVLDLYFMFKANFFYKPLGSAVAVTR